MDDNLEGQLWHEPSQSYLARNVSTSTWITNRTYNLGMPLWLPKEMLLRNRTRANLALASVLEPDMLSPFGVRSTSALDPRYSNANEIKPYSNWRGPIWVNVNAWIAYGARTMGNTTAAQDVGARVVKALADDLRNSGTWHECLDAETGQGLAAAGFLSWDTLGAGLTPNLAAGVNPFEL